MQTIKHKELAKRLALKALQRYRDRLIFEEDLMSGEDKRKVLSEFDKIYDDIKFDRVYRLNLENGSLKNKIEDFRDL